MNTVIGQKSEFAIEYKLNKTEPHIMGNVCIWLEGKYLGYLFEEIILGVFQNAFKQLTNRLNQLENSEFDDKSFVEIYKLIASGKLDTGKHIFAPGESFDDFIIYVYKKDDELNFIWKLCDEPFYNYPEYNNEINHKSIQTERFLECIERFNKELNSSIEEKSSCSK